MARSTSPTALPGPSCVSTALQLKRERSLRARFAEANGNYHNISNTWLVRGFPSSSPLTPATQSRLRARQASWIELRFKSPLGPWSERAPHRVLGELKCVGNCYLLHRALAALRALALRCAGVRDRLRARAPFRAIRLIQRRLTSCLPDRPQATELILIYFSSRGAGSSPN
jgi:hypothetical protein